jgi:predicted nucleic acid-binding Zn ribbon protein
LNVSRAPDHVLQKALAEAHKTLAGDPQAAIHSPLQNLALYYEAMTVQGKWSRQQAAEFLGTAAEKRAPISTETVEALNIILGVNTTDPAALAQDADLVRQRILEEHDAGGGESGH